METVQEEIKSGYKLTKVGWIPEDWALKKVINISKSLTSGSTPLRDKKEFFHNGGQNWVKTTDLNNSKISETEEQVSKLALEKTSLKVLPVNTVLVAMYGGFKQIGRTGILKTPCAINQALSAIQVDDEQIDTQYLQNWLNFGVKYWRRYAASSRKDPNITKSDVKDFLIPFGELKEQQAINSLLDSWDKAINNLAKLITEKQQKKKALIQLLLSGKKRFSGFDEEWKEVKLGEYFTERKESKRPDLPLLSIGSTGVYPQTESNKKDTSNADKAKYKRICPDDIGYNTMRMWQGRSALSSLEGIVSPAYTIVTPKENADVLFFSYLFKFPYVVHRFFRNSQGLVDDTLNCKFKDFAIVKVMVPPTKEEQTKISQVLINADSEIKILESKKVHLQDQKKGLMQQLLTGKKRLKY